PLRRQQKHNIALEISLVAQARRLDPAAMFNEADLEGNGEAPHALEIALVSEDRRSTLVGLDDHLVDDALELQERIAIVVIAPVHQAGDGQLVPSWQAAPHLAQELSIFAEMA